MITLAVVLVVVLLELLQAELAAEEMDMTILRFKLQMVLMHLAAEVAEAVI